MQKTNKLLSLFSTGLILMTITAANWRVVAFGNYMATAVTNMGIALFWARSVKLIQDSSLLEQIVYSVGSTAGVLLGIFFTKLIFGH